MLTRLSASGYKSLHDVDMSKLTQFVTVVGPNNSGKSALAELVLAIGNAQSVAVSSADLERVPNNGRLEAFSQPDDRFRIDGHLGGEHYSVSIVRQDQGRYGIEHARKEILELLQRQFRHIRYFGPFERLGVDNPIDISRTLDRYGERLASTLFFTFTNFRDTFDKILASFRRVFPELPDIRPKMRNVNSVHAEILTDGGFRELGDMGDGVSRSLAAIVGSWTTPDGATIFLEEPEAGLHPSVQRRLRRELERIAGLKEQQLIVLTHSPIWATATGPGHSVFQIANGTVERVESLDPVRKLLGARLSDLGFYDVILFCEGLSEERALPLFFAGQGLPLEENGIGLNNIEGQGSIVRLKDELASVEGREFHVALDGADHPKLHVEVAKDIGIPPNTLTLWHRENRGDGEETPGEFEDLFPVTVACAAFEELGVTWTEAEVREKLQAAPSTRKTSHVYDEMYRDATEGASFPKAEFCRLAMRIAQERTVSIPQLDKVLARLRDLVTDPP